MSQLLTFLIHMSPPTTIKSTNNSNSSSINDGLLLYCKCQRMDRDTAISDNDFLRAWIKQCGDNNIKNTDGRCRDQELYSNSFVAHRRRNTLAITLCRLLMWRRWCFIGHIAIYHINRDPQEQHRSGWWSKPNNNGEDKAHYWHIKLYYSDRFCSILYYILFCCLDAFVAHHLTIHPVQAKVFFGEWWMLMKRTLLTNCK